MAGSPTLVVALGGRRIGTLRRVRNGARFSYAPELAQAMQGVPLLSVAMPVRTEEYDTATTGSWFRGLLPEDARLESVKRFYGIGQGDWYDVLERIGWECAGAVSVMSEEDWGDCRAQTGGHQAAYRDISADELAERLAALPSYPYDTSDTLRMSLGGFQEKLCVLAPFLPEGTALVDARDFAIPIDGAPTSHIVKPQPSRFPGLVQAEAWAMHVCSHVTQTAKVAVLRLPNGLSALVVERYDRKRLPTGDIVRIHQEDCAQALGIDPEKKYATQSSPKKSDPSFRRIASLLRSHGVDDGRGELLRLFDQMVVNVALGNTDAHAKNFSLLHTPEGGVCLSPMYDIVPAMEITPGVRHMGMRIANQIALEKVGREELLSESRSWGLGDEDLTARLEDDLEKLTAGIEQASGDYPQAASRHEPAALQRIEHLRR